MDYKSLIDETRVLFQTKQYQKKDRIRPPSWITEDDPLRQVYRAAPELLQSGKIVYGHIVQANLLLYKKFMPYNCPASVLFSLDPAFDEHPEWLWRMACELYEYKGRKDVSAEMQPVVNAITDEMQCRYNEPLPKSFAEGREVYYSNIMVHRKHLYGRRLMGSLLPILANPDQVQGSMILPKHYWSQGMAAQFSSGHIFLNYC